MLSRLASKQLIAHAQRVMRNTATNLGDAIHVPHTASSGRDREQLIAQAAAVAVVVERRDGDRVTVRNLGRALGDARRAGSATAAVEPLAAVLHTIPVLFTVRDGWMSAPLRQVIDAARGLEFLTVEEGGVLRVGDRIAEAAHLVRAWHADYPSAPLFSVPSAAGE